MLDFFNSEELTEYVEKTPDADGTFNITYLHFSIITICDHISATVCAAFQYKKFFAEHSALHTPAITLL
jgi:hypothetical protein